MNQETLYPKHGNSPEQATGPGNVDNRRGVRDFYVAKAAENARQIAGNGPPCDERGAAAAWSGVAEICYCRAAGEGHIHAEDFGPLMPGGVVPMPGELAELKDSLADLWRHRAKLRDDISSLRSQLSTMQRERDEARAERDEVLSQRDAAAGGPDCRLPTWDEVCEAKRERDEARAEVASLKAAGNILLDESGCEFCEVALRKIVEFDHDKTPTAPGYWVCSHCYSEACARRSARIEELKAQLHPPSCPGCDSEQCERRGR